MSDPIESLTYKFHLADGGEKEFTVRLHYPSMRLEAPRKRRLPKWTRLEVHQCPNCPLKASQVPHCPVAVDLVDVIEFFKDCFSTDVADITIVSDRREYRHKTTLQDGLSSLMGLHMASSDCPILSKLRPMVYTHLPFSTITESMYRAISMYLVAQFLLRKRGEKPDWDLKHLMRIYADINVVNDAFTDRLTSINPNDASLNALAHLDCFAGFTTLSIEKDYFEELETLFEPYLKPAK